MKWWGVITPTEIGIRDPEVVGYVAHLLAEFCDAEQLFKVHNEAGKPLTDVGEMLLESEPGIRASSVVRP